MSIPVQASGQVRDIQISNSCNCCCWKRPKPTTPVYVHEDGRVEPLKTKIRGGRFQDAQLRSRENLTRVIGEMARARLIELSVVWEEAGRRGISLSPDMPVMMQTVRDLVQIIEEVSTPK